MRLLILILALVALTTLSECRPVEPPDEAVTEGDWIPTDWRDWRIP